MENTKRTLEGKVALVTGGSRGIGAAVAKRLAAEGAVVALTYSASPAKAEEVVQSIEAAGGKACAIAADARDAVAVKAAVNKTAEVYGGRIDILVNCAGVFTDTPIEQVTVEDFDSVMGINVRGPFVAIQETLKYMGEGGRIINIGSINSDYVPYCGGELYALTKAAVAGMTKAYARDLAPRGITINNVKPGPTNTDMNPANIPESPAVCSRTAVKRFADPSEIADFIAYLVGPTTGFITGAGLSIDGGYTA